MSAVHASDQPLGSKHGCIVARQGSLAVNTPPRRLACKGQRHHIRSVLAPGHGAQHLCEQPHTDGCRRRALHTRVQHAPLAAQHGRRGFGKRARQHTGNAWPTNIDEQPGVPTRVIGPRPSVRTQQLDGHRSTESSALRRCCSRPRSTSSHRLRTDCPIARAHSC
jgi:hypothetical protein